MVLGRPISITQQVSARLLLSFMIAVLLAFLTGFWFFQTTQEQLVSQLTQDAREHFRIRIEQLEFDWESDALRLKSLIEYTRVLENPEKRWLQLNGMLISQSSVSAIGGIAISDMEGRVLFSHGTMAHAIRPQMRAPAKGEWFYDAKENQIYHLYRQPIWLGQEGTGSLLVFRALDNSVLFQNHYPDTDLFLVREGKIVASASGSYIKSIPNPAFRGKVVRDGETYNQNSLPWIEGSPDAPLLIIQQKITTPLTPANMASMAIFMLAAYIFFAWLIVGRWMHGITRRTEHLVLAADNFSTKQHISDEIQNKFTAARTHLNDEIDQLARSLLDLMQTVESSNLVQQHHQDELKQQMLELKRINGELDEFTHFASHDLREPLRKLISFSELLRQDIGADLPAQAEEDLHYIEDAAIRMRALVDALLTLCDVGNSDFVPQRMELGAAASQALDALSLPIANSGAVIERDPLPPVMGDPILLTQLYQNLIGNALKYVAPACRPEIRLSFDPDNQTYGIKDNGIGINPGFATQIFKPFKRLHGRDEYQGSGIGLSICRKIVERHGGEIWVEPVPDGGSHFKFTLGSPLRQDNTSVKEA